MSDLKFVNQLTTSKNISGLVQENHLGWLGMKRPDLMSKVPDLLYETLYGTDNLVSWVDKMPTKYVNSEVYRWMLQGTDERNTPLIKATSDSAGSTVFTATDKPGQYGQPFYLWFPEKRWSKLTTLFGNRPELFALRVIADPIDLGGIFGYQVVPITGDDTTFIPVEELTANTQWSGSFALVEEGLSKGGREVGELTSPFLMENTMSTIRLEQNVPGNMILQGKNIPLETKFVSGGQTFTAWIDKLGWDFQKFSRRDKAMLLLYGRNTRSVDGTYKLRGESGGVLKAGYGMYEQMAGSHTGQYNIFNIDVFADFLLQVSYGRINEDSRKFVVTTGEYGFMQFHRELQKKLSAYNYFRSDHNLEKNADGKMQVNEKQITSYVYLNGIEILLMKDPMLDSPTVGKFKLPGGGYVTSYNYNIWDFGTVNGEANIQKVAIKGNKEYTIYIPGLRNPFTPNGMGMNPTPAASSVDGYSLHKMINGSIMIKNPLRCGRWLHAAYVGGSY